MFWSLVGGVEIGSGRGLGGFFLREMVMILVGSGLSVEDICLWGWIYRR